MGFAANPEAGERCGDLFRRLYPRRDQRLQVFATASLFDLEVTRPPIHLLSQLREHTPSEVLPG